MQNPAGIFIVLEGSDGSGKSTQFRLLSERLKAVGYDIEVFKFPRYDNQSSYFIQRYLNGAYGKASDVSPYTATLFYALDRYEAGPSIRQALADGKIVVCDRYVGSNMAHQGGKITDSVEQRSYFVWEDSLEYQMLGIPQPNINLFLNVPAEISQKLASKDSSRKNRQYTKNTKDQHEMDINHLKKSVATYQLLCQLFPNDYTTIDCVKDGKLLSILDINNLIWDKVQPILPQQLKKQGRSVTLRLEEPKASKSAKSEPTSQPDINEMLTVDTQISLLLSSIISQRLGPAITTKLNWAKNNYQYYTPSDLPRKSTQKYHLLMAEMVSIRRRIDKRLRDKNIPGKLVYPGTPLAALTNVKIHINLKGAEDLAGYLISTSSAEAIELATKINRLAKLKWSSIYRQPKTVSVGSEPEPINNILDRLVHDYLPQTLPDVTSELEILDATPKNEFRLLVDTLYSQSDLPTEQLELQVSNLNYQQKVDALIAALNSGLIGRLGQLSYKFDITAGRYELFELRKLKGEATINAQLPTPRYGYEVPDEIDRADITDDYLALFDKSLEVYSSLQSTTHSHFAAYGTLLGHKCRFQLVCSLNYILRLSSAPRSLILNTLIENLITKVSEVHPIIGSVISKQANRPRPRVKKIN